MAHQTSGPRRLGLLALSLAATAMLAACGNGSDDRPEPVTKDDLVDVLPRAKGGVDVVKWNLPAEPDTLDPANTVTYASGTVVRSLCDTLLTRDPDLALKPNLASYEVVSPTEIVYTIRDDVKFWDGTPLTAEDVAWSLNRMRSSDFVLSFAFINVKSIDVTGPDQVTVSFSEPDELFLNSGPALGVMEKKYSEEHADAIGTPDGGLMCSGPFELESWSPGSSIKLSRNPDYWNAERKPFAETVAFSFVGDATALTQALNAGEIDGAYEIPASAVPALSKSSVGRITFGRSMQGLNLNVARPDGPMSDNDVRQALQRGIDRGALADVIYNGAAEPTYTYVTPTTWPEGQKDAYQKAYDAFVAEREYDVEAAKKLVAKSGYDGETIVLALTAGDDTESRSAQLIQEQAAAIGLTVKLKPLQPLVYDQAGYDAAKRKELGLDLMLSSNFNGAPDPLEPMGFTSLPGQPYNYTDFDDAEATALLTEARQTFDDDQRAEMVIKAQQIIEEDSAVIPLLSTYTTTFLNDRLTGAITSFAYWSMPAMAFIGAAK